MLRRGTASRNGARNGGQTGEARSARWVVGLTWIGACCAAVPALAQTAHPEAEEIIVTATKSETKLSDTPLAVSAFTQDTLEKDHVNDLAGLQLFVPNLTVEQHGDSGGVHVYLRGVGSSNNTELGDPAVAFHVDEVYAARPQGATILMFDVDRVEVLRGPQGTLFGRNSTAGSVNVVTAKPRLSNFESGAQISAGSYGQLGLRAMLNVPVSETFGLRAALATEQNRGFIDFQSGSAVGGQKPGSADQKAIRLTALFEPTERWAVTTSVDYFKDRGAGNIALMQNPRPGEDLYSARVDTRAFLAQDNLAYRLRTDYRPLDNIELSYLGGFTRLERRNATDQDGGTRAGFRQEHRTDGSTFDSFSHELRVRSTGPSRFQWIGGAFYMQEDNDIRFDIDISQSEPLLRNGALLVSPRAPDDTAFSLSFVQPKRTLDSKAVYAQGTYSFTDAFRFTGGARYTDERKEDKGGRNFACPSTEGSTTVSTGGRILGAHGPVNEKTCRVTSINDGKTQDDKVTWLARTEYDFTPDLLSYASMSTGFKSGGLSDGNRRHKPEELTNYELGIKTTLLPSLNLNLAAFYMAYRDLQVSAVEKQADGTQQLVTSNAAKATIRGLEAELSWRPTSADTITGFASLLDAKFDEFKTVDTTFFAADDPGNTVDLGGEPLKHAPTFSMTGIYEHEFELASGARIVPRVSVHYETESTLTPFNDVFSSIYRDAGVQDAYAKTDLSLRYEAASGRWGLEAFVQNLTDEEIKTDIQNSGGSADGRPGTPPSNLGVFQAYYNAPRTWGLRLFMRM